ncbi:MAG: gamma carbonic anhydrase family protein [Verrucomicrobia bacterium]|nr:gamma carbonic anhydrase family protein [Verrucomicrobiota bacterium]
MEEEQRPPVWQRLERYLSQTPQVDPSAYVAPGVALVGAVTVGAWSSLWYGTVVRADINRIDIGSETNVQDGCVLHVADDFALRIGNGVSCGHRAILHACTVEDHVLIGMGACVMDGARVEAECIVGAHALVPKGARIPSRALVLGSPGRVVRQLSESEIGGIRALASKYVEVARHHRGRGFTPAGAAPS